MQFGPSMWPLFRLTGSSSISVFESPPRFRAISLLVANFSSSSSISGSGSSSSSSSGQYTSRRGLPQEEESRGVRVLVWWDFENCHLPAGTNVFKLSQTITAAVRTNGIKGPITITAFGDVMQLSRTNQEALSVTGITLTHVPQGGKNSTDKSLIADLMCWVLLNPPPAHIFLISSDRDFATVLHKLRMSNYNILLASEQESKSNVLCSAASIMWNWNDLVKGIVSTGKHINHPPDGPYNSWYGHYKTPLLNPSSITTTKQQSCTSVKTEESSIVCRPIPEKVVKQIGLIVSLYPKGVPITKLREQLINKNVLIDKDFYGHQKFSRFLLSMPEIIEVVPQGDGMFLVCACSTKEKDNIDKASSQTLSDEDPKVVSLEKMHHKVKENDEDVKEESQSQMSCQEHIPVKENHGDSLSLEKVVVSHGETGTASSTSNESAEVVKAETEVCNRKSASPGLLSRFWKRLMFYWGKSTELSNDATTGTQVVDDVFAKDSFWKDVESFINSPRGFLVVSHSRSREAMAKNIKDEGPSSLKLLDVTKILDLVSLLISEKKWIKENPSDPLPFRVSRLNCLSNNPHATDGLRSIFVSMSKSLCDEVDDEKRHKNIGMSQKSLERSRSEVIGDCRKLIKKITEENPGGYNMNNFLEKFGYHLDYQNLGYPKLQSLIQLMPEARIESGYIVPSSMPAPYESESSFEEVGPVSESSVSEEEKSDSETEEEASLEQSGVEWKKKTKNGDGTKSDLLQILGSWDTSEDVKKEKKDCGFSEDKLVEGILISLGKKPSSESRIQE